MVRSIGSLIVLLITCHLVGQQALIQKILQKEGQYLADKSIQVLNDSSGKFNLSQVQQRQDWWVPSFAKGLVFPEPGVYWLRFYASNESTKENWILEFPDIHQAHVDFYRLSSEGKLLDQQQAGYDQEFSRRPYDHKNYFFDLHLPQGAKGWYYVRIATRYRSSYGAYIRSTQFEFSYVVREYYLLGFFYGILLIMATYNLFLYFFTKERIYLFYVAYVLAGALYSMNEDGTGFQFVWRQWPALNHFLFVYSPLFFLGTFLAYGYAFLQPPMRNSYFRLLVLSLVVLNILSHTLYEWVPPYLRALLYMAPFLYMYFLAIHLFRKGHISSRFFLAGFSIILISFFVYFFRMAKWIPTNLYTFYVFNVGMILETVIMSYALGERFRLLKNEKEFAQQKIIEQLKENDRLKDKVNQELESKVAERTEQLRAQSLELMQANEKLKELTDALNSMNIALDKDNWELKKQVKEEKRSRILLEKVSYEEFLKIYPTEYGCLSYLEQLKWSEGYHCKKCGNANFVKNEKNLARRCTRCKYSESVTAATLFHGIKFPLTKAFYVMYDTCNSKNKSTLDELSDKIDLRRVTVWMFRKKVMEALAKNPKLKNAGWESLVLLESVQPTKKTA
ncbi:MAG: chromosome segregation ATPase [Cytophagaceae bacterium]|jgi:hypothetical protein|nr:chromosome segregation ATPase [Cytophagaceae bacterium]